MTRNEAQGKAKQKVVTRAVVQRQITELRKKIKATLNQAAEAEEHIKSLREEEVTLAGQIDSQQSQVADLQQTVETLNEDVMGFSDAKKVVSFSLVFFIYIVLLK